MHRIRRGLVLLCYLLAAAGGAAAATEPETIPHDHYRAGGDLDLHARVLGDLAIAGVWTRFDGRVAGDLMAAAGSAELHGRYEDDVRAAGGRLRLDGRVGDQAVLAGLDVTLGPKADVGGRAWIGGGRVRIDGRVRGRLDIAAGEVILAGRVDGPVRIRADSLRVLSGARLGGDVVYRARDPAEVEPGARVEGALTFHHVPAGGSGTVPATADDEGLSATGVLVRVLALLVPGLLLRLAVPGLLSEGHATLAREPLLSLGLGGALLILGPLVVIGLCLFVITIPLSVAALMLAFPVALAGYVVTAGMLADRVAARLVPERAGTLVVHGLALTAVLSALAVLQALPVAGMLVLGAATLCGTGAGSVAVYRRFNRSRPPPAA